MSELWRDLRGQAYCLIEPRCPCYCGGEGVLILIACPSCNFVFGRCDEVEELILDVNNPVYDSEGSVADPNSLCPKCGNARYGQFRAGTIDELKSIGLRESQIRLWW